MDTTWKSHAKIGRIAADALTAKEKAFLDFPAENCKLPGWPLCSNGLEQLAASCLIMDSVYDPRYHNYCLQDDGLPLTHTLPDEDGRPAFFSGKAPSPGKFAEILSSLMQHMISAIHNGDRKELLIRGGILGHFLQDVTAPTHTILPEQLRALFPDPVPGRIFKYGEYCYQLGDTEIPPVQNAASSVKEAVFLLTQQAWQAYKSSQRLLPELTACAYRENKDACRTLLLAPARDAAIMTAYAWHCAFSIAEKGECPKASGISLTELTPLYRHPDAYLLAPSNAFALGGKYVPMNVIGTDGTVRFSEGFGMTGYSGMKFFLNGLFHTLEFQLALADMPESRDANIDVDFTVEISSKWDETFSEDMDYGTIPVFRAHIGPGEAIQTCQVDISSAATLAFVAKAKPYQNSNGTTNFAVPHIAILNPRVS